jgi:hypothetical protein
MVAGPAPLPPLRPALAHLPWTSCSPQSSEPPGWGRPTNSSSIRWTPYSSTASKVTPSTPAAPSSTGRPAARVRGAPGGVHRVRGAHHATALLAREDDKRAASKAGRPVPVAADEPEPHLVVGLALTASHAPSAVACVDLTRCPVNGPDAAAAGVDGAAVPTNFHHRLRQLGRRLIFDLHKNQRGVTGCHRVAMRGVRQPVLNRHQHLPSVTPRCAPASACRPTPRPDVDGYAPWAAQGGTAAHAQPRSGAPFPAPWRWPASKP